MRARAWVLLLLFCGCKDEGLERYQQAAHQYQELVDHGVPPNDARFAEVLKLLDEVPSSSTARPRADGLRKALQGAQGPKVRTPLAISGGANLPPPVAEQLARCRKLAEEMGTTAEGERAAKLKELDGCRETAERLDAAHVHSEAGH
jgi:hypothetical protein